MIEILSQNATTIFLWIVGTVIVAGAWGFFLVSRVPQAMMITIVGFKCSGKSTLITALFREMLAGRLPNFRITMVTRLTNERVNKNIASLESKIRLEPTEEENAMVYRANLRYGKWVKAFRRLELADFPGEWSKEFASQLKEHSKEDYVDKDYKQWVYESEAIIFVIDCAEYLAVSDTEDGRLKYVADTTATVRYAWQQVLNSHYAGERRLKSYPVVLAFTKCDLVNFVGSDKSTKDLVLKYGYQEFPGVPGHYVIDEQKLEEEIAKIRGYFSELGLFFEQTSDNFSIVFTSSVGTVGGKALGLEDLLKALLPPPPFQ